jgi:hypothetical protein
LTNKGAAGAGTDAILSKDTKATGGTAFAAYDVWDAGVPSATYGVLNAYDVVTLTFTKASSATAFAEAIAVIEYMAL